VGTALVWAAAVVLPEAQAVRSDQQILFDLEQRWARAFLERDAESVDGLLAEDFMAVYADGSRGDRARELEQVASFNQQVDSSRFDEFTARVYGDTAVVSFVHVMVGPVQGEPTEISFRYLDVWVVRDGEWRCVASQSTRVGTP
jgi:ketosteroid isomerase-like protein